MNIRYVFLLLAVAFAITASAQDVPKDYKKLLTDGKVWHCIERYWNRDFIDRNYSDSVCGDTLVYGLVCKRIRRVYADEPTKEIFYAMYEERKKVYGINVFAMGEPRHFYSILDLELVI